MEWKWIALLVVGFVSVCAVLIVRNLALDREIAKLEKDLHQKRKDDAKTTVFIKT